LFIWTSISVVDKEILESITMLLFDSTYILYVAPDGPKNFESVITISFAVISKLAVSA